MTRIRRFAVVVAFVVLGALGTATGASALSPPELNLDMHSNQTYFQPGGEAAFWFDVANVGGTETS